MENIRGKLNKNITLQQKKKRAQRWTLLLVGEYSRTIVVKHSKIFVFGAILMLVLAIFSSVFLFFLYKNKLEEVRNVQGQLTEVSNQLAQLTEDKNELLVRAIMAESALGLNQNEQNSTGISEKTADRLGVLTKQSTDVSEKHSNNDTYNIAKAAAISEVRYKEPVGKPQKPSSSIRIENLSISRDRTSGKLILNFRMKNVAYDLRLISGYVFVVLKKNINDEKSWLIIPSVNLFSDKSRNYKKGQRFSIRRYKDFSIKVGIKADPRSFSTASVFIFDQKGNEIAEKNFVIETTLE